MGPLPARPQRGLQRGLSAPSLLLWALLVAAAALAAVRVLPSVNEYYAVRRAVERLAATNGTPAEIRAAYERLRGSEPPLAVLHGDDLAVEREGDQVVIRFAYAKEIELMAPVYLLIKYHGRSR